MDSIKKHGTAAAMIAALGLAGVASAQPQDVRGGYDWFGGSPDRTQQSPGMYNQSVYGQPADDDWFGDDARDDDLGWFDQTEAEDDEWFGMDAEESRLPDRWDDRARIEDNQVYYPESVYGIWGDYGGPEGRAFYSSEGARPWRAVNRAEADRMMREQERRALQGYQSDPYGYGQQHRTGDARVLSLRSGAARSQGYYGIQDDPYGGYGVQSDLDAGRPWGRNVDQRMYGTRGGLYDDGASIGDRRMIDAYDNPNVEYYPEGGYGIWSEYGGTEGRTFYSSDDREFNTWYDNGN